MTTSSELLESWLRSPADAVGAQAAPLRRAGKVCVDGDSLFWFADLRLTRRKNVALAAKLRKGEKAQVRQGPLLLILVAAAQGRKKSLPYPPE
jgi:hypothetical protein